MTGYPPTMEFTKVVWIESDLTEHDITSSGSYNWGEFIKSGVAFDIEDYSTWHCLLIRPDETTNTFKDDTFEIHYTGTPNLSGSRGNRLVNRSYAKYVTDYSVLVEDIIAMETWGSGEDETEITNSDFKPTYYNYMFMFISHTDDFDVDDEITFKGETIPRPINIMELFSIEIMTKFVITAVVGENSYSFSDDVINIEVNTITSFSITFDITQYNIDIVKYSGTCEVDFKKASVSRSGYPIEIAQGTNSKTFNFDSESSTGSYTYTIESIKSNGHKGSNPEREITINVTIV